MGKQSEMFDFSCVFVDYAKKNNGQWKYDRGIVVGRKKSLFWEMW